MANAYRRSLQRSSPGSSSLRFTITCTATKLQAEATQSRLFSSFFYCLTHSRHVCCSYRPDSRPSTVLDPAANIGPRRQLRANRGAGTPACRIETRLDARPLLSLVLYTDTRIRSDS